eukprot:7167793-Prymnesium_polylepis.1
MPAPLAVDASICPEGQRRSSICIAFSPTLVGASSGYPDGRSRADELVATCGRWPMADGRCCRQR